MKKLASFRILWLVSVLAVAILVTVSSCDDVDVSWLEFSITGQPTGGVNVRSVQCAFEGWLDAHDTGDATAVEPVTVTATWTTPAGAHGAEKFTFRGYHANHTFTFTKAAPSGLFLDKDFWVVFTWTDYKGPHTVTSGVAHCTVQ